MAVSKEKQEQLQKRLADLGVEEKTLLEKFILGSGRGGQKLNKTASTVYLKHLPTGIEVKCGKDRSRELNRFLARRELCERLEKSLHGTPTKREREQDKIRKQKARQARRRRRHLPEQDTGQDTPFSAR
ncbi:MAG: Peptide chain release factor 1 [Chlamydiae bacterium]|nr:Peptide chain release factor 1 [Chlamydiota bacterium]